MLSAARRNNDPHPALLPELRHGLRLTLLNGLVQAFALLRGQGRLAAGFLFLSRFLRLFFCLRHRGSLQ